MPVDEKFSGRSGGALGTPSAWAELTFIAWDRTEYIDAPAAVAAVLDASPPSFGGLARESVSDWREIAGEDAYEVTIRYSALQLTGETGQSSFSFRTSGGTQHITQSIENKRLWKLAYTGETSEMTDVFGGAIGPTTEGVEGADIVVPIFEFEETHFLPASQVTIAYRALLIRLTGTTNANPFKGLDVGEGLFLGADGHMTGDDQWQLTFYFAGSPNREDLKIGSLVGIDKKGWELLWVQYKDEANEDYRVMVKTPFIVGVEKVYEEADWSELGIGT
jgi:hypothetical protein